MSFHINPHALYSLDELRDLLHGLVELDTFLDRVGLRDNRIFRNCLTGQEIIVALEEARRSGNSFSRREEGVQEERIVRREPCERGHSKRKLGVKDLRD